MSDRKINIIIIAIVILSIFAAVMLMQYSPKRNNIDITETKVADKIKILNDEISKSITNSKSHFTVTLSNYELNDKTINIDINVKKNKDETLQIDRILIDNNVVNIRANPSFIDFRIGIIKEDEESKFMYLTTTTGSLDGEGDVIIFNNSGNILYQNNKAFLEELDNESYLIKEKYCDALITLTCQDNDMDDIAFKNITYKSINGQLVNIDYQEIKIADICY